MQFTTMFDPGLTKVAREVSNGATLKVFLVLPQHLSFTVFRKLDQRKLGGELGLDNSAVSRALKQLHGIGSVEKRGAGAHIEWRLSPDFGWRGDVDSFHVEQRRRAATKPKPGPAGDSPKSHKIYPDIPAGTVADAAEQKQTRLRLLRPMPTARRADD